MTSEHLCVHRVVGGGGGWIIFGGVLKEEGIAVWWVSSGVARPLLKSWEVLTGWAMGKGSIGHQRSAYVGKHHRDPAEP